MKAIRLLIAALLLITACLPVPAAATSATTDQSDLWWNPNESGWGIQLVERDKRIFATMYVYGNASQPTWYTALMDYQGNFVWTGDLYVSAGPWFGAVPYDPTLFSDRKVGTMTWTANFVQQATLNYSVDGVGVTKNVVRTYIATDNFAGSYAGAIHETLTSCSNPAFNGTFDDYAAITVRQNGTSFNAGFAAQSGLGCTFSGTLTQGGQFGTVTGTYSCTTGEVGNFTVFEMAVTLNFITGRFSTASTNVGCQATGNFGGMRHQ